MTADERPAGSGEELCAEEEEAIARMELEEEFATVYEIAGVTYCGMCNQPLNHCVCFTDEPDEPDEDEDA